jgi:hypothetical protein
MEITKSQFKAYLNTNWVFSRKYSGKFLKKFCNSFPERKNSGKFLYKLNEPNSCNFLRWRTELLFAVRRKKCDVWFFDRTKRVKKPIQNQSSKI